MRRLHGQLRDYAWGSRSAIASLQGRPVPSARPEAELWLGAHPSGPARLDEAGGPGLDEAIGRDPARLLGPAVLDRYGARLPYLLKVLAAAQPLSLQAHPDADQARSGYARDAQIPEVERTYVDAYHKPELLVAVSEFDALCGFRDPSVSATVLDSFGVAALGPVVAALRSGPVQLRLSRATQTLLRWPAADRAGLVAEVEQAAARQGGPDAELALDLAKLYPGDVGVLVALLLNRVRLRPDEAVFMPAGNLHAYLGGLGIEVMAASDNVLRGGLTPKRVDVDELLRILRYDVLADPVLPAFPVAPGLSSWSVPLPVAEFALVKAAIAGAAPVRLGGAGPRVVLCVSGVVRLRSGEQEMVVRQGEAVFLDATEPEAVLTDGAVPTGPAQPSGVPTAVFQANPG